ncbi:MAG: hypothetical protein WC494_02330 [Candidatus Pacearchaeota archaeon]
MHSLIHLVIAFVLGISFQLDFLSFLIFVISSIIIDLDHVLELKKVRRTYLKKYLFHPRRFKKQNYQSPQKSLHIFHTCEIILLLFILSIFYPIIFWIATSFSIHLLTDALGNFWNRNIGNAGGEDWIKYWFLTYYLLKGSVYNKENL